MLSVIGGLWVMSGSAPLAAQAGPSASRSFSSATVMPGAEFTVTIASSDYGSLGAVTETLPDGFTYVSQSGADAAAPTGQQVRFTLLGSDKTFSYVVMASGTDGDYTFNGVLRDDDAMDTAVGGDSMVTVSTATPTPVPTATPVGPVMFTSLPDLDNLDPASQTVFMAADAKNSLSYTAASGSSDAMVTVRVSPGMVNLINVDLGIPDFPDTQQVNFSLTDGDNLQFRVSKTGADMAEIVSVGSLTSGQYEFKLVVNEYENAPVNTEDVDVVVDVVIDNQAPEFDADAPTSGTVAERAMSAMIATFSASDVNNQVLTYSISDGAAALGLTLDSSTGVLMTTDAEEMPVDQPDFDESDGASNEHTLTIMVSDGTASASHEFTLTVTDVDDPPPGSEQKLTVDEGMGGGMADPIGSAPALGGSGDYSIGQQIDNMGNITLDSDDILFGVDASTGALYLKTDKSVDFESGTVTYTLSVSRGDNSGIVVVTVNDVNEAPMFSASDKARAMPIMLYVLESAAMGTVVSIGQDAGSNPTTIPATFTASDEDSAATGSAIAYDLWSGDSAYSGGLFSVSSNGTISVSGELDTDADDAVDTVDLTLRAVDAGEQDDMDPMSSLADTLMLRVIIIDTNVAPEFDAPSRAMTHATISEGVDVGTEVFPGKPYHAIDDDGDEVKYRLRDQDDAPFFSIGADSGVLTTNAGLDYEKQTSHTVEIQAYDTDGDTDEIVLTVDVTNENDEMPMWMHNPLSSVSVPENTARGMKLGNSYEAVDPDGFPISYKLTGKNKDSFSISDSGVLMTLESLDYDRPVPCDKNVCSVTVEVRDVSDSEDPQLKMEVSISVTPVEDSVSTLSVKKANPVPGTAMGNPMTALGGTKMGMGGIAERPSDLPAAGSAPMNFVDTEWGNWGTVLRIVVTSESPDPNCGNGNQCVVVNVNSDSADDSLKLQAYRMDTPGAVSNENKFVAAVKLVELDTDATPGDAAVYKHTDGTVPALKVDEEDEIEIEFGNLRSSIDVENEAPEIDNFSPVHEMAFDDADVDYAFTITDEHSGLPEPEDLPDNDGNADYTPVVALISQAQCETHSGSAPTFKTDAGILNAAAHIHEDETLYCPGAMQDGEYEANKGGYGFAPIRDDKDFNDVDGGYDVETTIVLTENRTYYVTFIVCDNAGNCAFYDPDGNDDNEELAQITVDTLKPDFVEARTGVTWDSTDNEYDDNRNYIQVIFNELTQLNPETVEVDDFVVEGHTIKDVYVFETPDDDDVNWADSGNFADEGHKNLRRVDRYRDIENTVFIELEDELLADETPDVTLVPNGVEDGAGNEQDDGEQEADDWISPKFTIVSIVSPRETTQSQVLAGDNEEVVVTVTSDERLDQTRPTVTVTYVNAPDGSVDTKGVAGCENTDGTDGTRKRGEIVVSGECQDNGAATGGTLNTSVEKVSNTEWVVTITEPKATGYYNFHITGIDRSPQENRGSEGVSPGSIVTDFFDSDGDVNVDDAVFFEGDVNLSRPNVRVSGDQATDNEPDVEYRSPLFVELDFTKSYGTAADCRDDSDDDYTMNCVAETKEYAKDNFDSVTVTRFELDGVDITDSVKTTDDETFLVSIENISVGDHTVKIQAMDMAGNELDDVLEIDFEVSDRDPFDKRLSPGWNLVSLPGEPADSSIDAVFGASVEVRTVYTYDPVIPGGWMVAVRETLDSDWQGDLTEINGQRGYWVLSDAIQDWEVAIPRLAGGAVGTGTPIQPPVIALYAGWNLIPVTDVRGNALDDGKSIDAETYLQSLDDGLDLARVLGFNTIKNQWSTILDPDTGGSGELQIGSAYWVFVREAASLVPGGVAD